MPIYSYKCRDCGYADDVLQKVYDNPLKTCPSCGKDSYSKQVSVPHFQLKGNGWYVTDFRNNSGNKSINAQEVKSEVKSSDPIIPAKKVSN